ncbi:MAG: hypothetical protein KatS3mg131_2685 [Candidatus Tectimicrobiota bacterium]|nr:MAG: hypothetical protein KatS3mg131_2685 [Candidatus Tectomicrobia bacterium]
MPSGALLLSLLLCSVLAAYGLPRSARAQAVTLIVDTTSDVSDFGGAQQVDDLPGPDGKVSLREAITAANHTPGPERIAFRIPTGDPGFTGSVFFIQIANTPPLTLRDDGITLDGTTQTAFTGDTNPAGPEVVLHTTPPLASLNGLTLDSNDNLITGLGGFSTFRYGIEINGSRNRIVGNVIGGLSAGVHLTGSDNRIGGPAPGEGNVISSGGNGVWIRFASATGNVVQGNLITGNHNNGVAIEAGATGNLIGGPAPGEGNVINNNGHLDAERHPVGAQVALAADHNTVQGNYLGVDATGQQDESGSARCGISLVGSFNTLGGPFAGNVISGHGFTNVGFRAGICISGGAHNVIQGNFIGTDASGLAPIPNEKGILVSPFLLADPPRQTVIGGRDAGAGNFIAFNDEFGVAVEGFGESPPMGITLTGNAIFANGQLGIDLGNDGVTPNDPGDGDTGPNGLLNFPVLTAAIDDGTATVVSGVVDTLAPETLTVELYSNDAADATGFGEGQVFQATATPEASGRFRAFLPAGLAGHFITALAIDAQGNTSEFSPAMAAVAAEALLTLEGPLPGQAGTLNTFTLTQATPGASVALLAGVAAGSSPLAGCGETRLGIGRPRRLRRAIADAAGRARFQVVIPGRLRGRTLLFQAVERASCRVSNLILSSF